MISEKLLRIRFDRVDGFITVYDRTRYLVLFGAEKYDFIYTGTRYLIEVKSGITYAVSHNYAKIKVDPHDFFPQEKSLTLHNVIIQIKINKDKNNY